MKRYPGSPALMPSISSVTSMPQWGHGRGKMNDNGQRLLELCCYHGLCVTNTFFPCKDIHQVSWRHPRSRHWHQLDLVLTKRRDLASVLLTRTYHSADCDTDHSLVASKVRIGPRKLVMIYEGKPGSLFLSFTSSVQN